MKTIREAWGIYEDYTGLASTNARKLAFGVAAVGWFFKQPDATFPVLVTISLGLLVIYFLCDLAQYVWGAHIRRRYILEKEPGSGPNGTVDEDVKIEWPTKLDDKTIWFWRAKMFFLASSSLVLVAHFLVRLAR